MRLLLKQPYEAISDIAVSVLEKQGDVLEKKKYIAFFRNGKETEKIWIHLIS